VVDDSSPLDASALTPSSPARHWWSPQPPAPDLPELSTGRAYLEVLVVFGVFFGASVVAAGFSVAGDLPNSTLTHWGDAIPDTVDQVAQTVLCIMVPVLLVGRRGLGAASLGLSKPKIGVRPVSAGIRMAAWALLALLAGGIVTTNLTNVSLLGGRFTYPDLVLNLFHALQAGFIEEIVVLGFVVVTLEQARRPRMEIFFVGLTLRMSYHIYYGPGVVGIAIWASLFLWLYWRYRSIVPLIVVHCAWDVFAVLGDRWRGVGGVEVLLILALFITAPVLWLVDRSAERATRVPTSRSGYAVGVMPPTTAPWRTGSPGWYTEPFMAGFERWFDGTGWTTRIRPAEPRDDGQGASSTL
jgi:hypothetical protein